MLELLRLIEHPGGHDGGVFPCRETFKTTITTEGTVTVKHTYGIPESPTDTFSDQEPSDYDRCPTTPKAIEVLEQELSNLRHQITWIEKILKDLKNPSTTYVSEDELEADFNDN